MKVSKKVKDLWTLGTLLNFLTHPTGPEQIGCNGFSQKRPNAHVGGLKPSF